MCHHDAPSQRIFFIELRGAVFLHLYCQLDWIWNHVGNTLASMFVHEGIPRTGGPWTEYKDGRKSKHQRWSHGRHNVIICLMLPTAMLSLPWWTYTLNLQAQMACVIYVCVTYMWHIYLFLFFICACACPVSGVCAFVSMCVRVCMWCVPCVGEGAWRFESQGGYWEPNLGPLEER